MSLQSCSVRSAVAGSSEALRIPRSAARWRETTTPPRNASSSSAIATRSMGLGSDVLAPLRLVRHREAHLDEYGVDLGDVLRARLGVRAALQAPVPIALCASRTGVAEHVQSSDIPEVDCLLHSLFLRTADRRELGCACRAVVDVTFFLVHDTRRMIDHGRERLISAS